MQEATYDIRLQAYRATPHPATKTTPYELLMNRQVRTKLVHYPTEQSPQDHEVRNRDELYKKKVKSNHDKRHRSKQHTFKIGDAAVVKRERKRKAETPFEPYIYIITEIRGSTIHAKRVNDGKTICRDTSKVKLLRTAKISAPDQPETAPARQPTVPPAVPTQAAAEQQTTAEQTRPIIIIAGKI